MMQSSSTWSSTRSAQTQVPELPICNSRFLTQVSYIIELAQIDLKDLKMLKYRPSLLVASSLQVALKVLSLTL